MSTTAQMTADAPEASGVREPAQRYANSRDLKSIRQDLRNHATPAERALWQMLKKSQLHGRKFRRQHGIARYVVDFYCPSEKLAIELDGSIHADPLRWEHDTQRQRQIEALGIRVLRFENEAVLTTPDVVVEAIASQFAGPLAPP